MGNEEKMINLLMLESPPPYNPVNVSDAAVLRYNHPGYNSSGLPLDKNHEGNYPDHGIAFNGVTGRPGITNLELLKSVVAGHGKLTFQQSQSIGYGGISIICQIRGSENQIVMSTLRTTNFHGENARTSSTTLRFSDQTGKALFITEHRHTEYTVSCGDMLVGLVSRRAVSPRKSTQLKGWNSNGDTVFEVVQQGSEYYFQDQHGRTIAVAWMRGEILELEFKDSSLDVQSRALVITGAYSLFEDHHAKTTSGIGETIVFAILFFVACFASFMLYLMLAIFLVKSSKREY